MDIDEELDLMLFAVIVLKMERKKERIIFLQDLYKIRECFGIQRLAREIFKRSIFKHGIFKKLSNKS